MSDCKAFLDFCAKVDDTAVAFLEELCDMAWSSDKKSERIRISSSHTHDACNHTYSGTFLHEGVEYGFVIDNGNWNGTVVREWGPADDIGTYEAPRPTIYTFIPINGALKEDSAAMWGVYLAWRKTEWFRKMEHDYNYDRHFAPGGKTESHYREMAAKRGMKIASQEVADEIINRPKRNLIPAAEIAAALAEQESAR